MGKPVNSSNSSSFRSAQDISYDVGTRWEVMFVRTACGLLKKRASRKVPTIPALSGWRFTFANVTLLLNDTVIGIDRVVGQAKRC